MREEQSVGRQRKSREQSADFKGIFTEIRKVIHGENEESFSLSG